MYLYVCVFDFWMWRNGVCQLTLTWDKLFGHLLFAWRSHAIQRKIFDSQYEAGAHQLGQILQSTALLGCLRVLTASRGIARAANRAWTGAGAAGSRCCSGRAAAIRAETAVAVLWAQQRGIQHNRWSGRAAVQRCMGCRSIWLTEIEHCLTKGI